MGNWSNGKLNGKGVIIKHNLKQKCTWRFGRLITSVISLNKKIILNERIYEFLDNQELLNLLVFKNKTLHNYLTKNNCENLLKLKIFECLTYNNTESHTETKNFISKYSLYNKHFFEIVLKTRNFEEFFNSIFENSCNTFIPTVAVKCNGGYAKKIFHYSNAFDPSRKNNYTSNFTKCYSKDVDITGVFESIPRQMKNKILEEYNAKKLSSEIKIEDKNNVINKILLECNDIDKKTTEFEIQNIDYINNLTKIFKENKSSFFELDGNKNIRIFRKFLLGINFNKIFKYRKLNENLEIDRFSEVENLLLNKEIFSEIFKKHINLIEFDFNKKITIEKKVYENIKFTNTSFCINKILIDVPFNTNILNKLTLPVKTLVFFIHNKRIENLSDIDISIQNNLNEKEQNLNNKIFEFTNNNFLSKYSNCFEDSLQLNNLLQEIKKITSYSESDNSSEKLTNNISINKSENINIINIQKSKDNLFIEFDTYSQLNYKGNDMDMRLLGLCFLQNYDLPNILLLKPYFHFGKMITVRLVNQNVLNKLSKESCIDVGSITFYGDEFKNE